MKTEIRLKTIVFVSSRNAEHSFLDLNNIREKPVLVDVCVARLKAMWLKSTDGELFYGSIDGCEKPEKVDGAMMWLQDHSSIWAPVVEWRPWLPDQVSFLDGRHTFCALERMGYKKARVSVRASLAMRIANIAREDAG